MLRLVAVGGAIVLLAPVVLVAGLSLAGFPIGGILVALAVGALAIRAEGAPTFWSAAYNTPIYYHSIDPTPIEVSLANENQRSYEARLRIPRAYLVYANQYLPKDTGHRLPNQVTTNHVILALTVPDGKALSIHAVDVARGRRIDAATAEKSLRHAQIQFDMRFVGPNAPGLNFVRKSILGRTVKVGAFDGLDELQMPIGDQLYYPGREGEDEFSFMSCPSTTHSAYWCTAYLNLRQDLGATVSFADFRVHGGRAFANERIRWLRQFACRFYDPPCS